MPSAAWPQRGYPHYEALRSWCRVCDEIIIITNKDENLQFLFNLAGKEMPETEHKCSVAVHSIDDPPLTDFASYGSYLLFGMLMCSSPDWVISIEADFLISPTEASKLRNTLLGDSENEILMADVLTINYDGTKLLHTNEFKSLFPPNDGCTWHRPIGYRPKAGILPVPYAGVDRRNHQTCCEGIISIQPGKWGLSFNSKFQNHNPLDFKLLRTKTVVEHLTFSRDPSMLLTKMEHPSWEARGITIKTVIEGTEPYDVSYPELDMARERYGELVKILV